MEKNIRRSVLLPLSTAFTLLILGFVISMLWMEDNDAKTTQLRLIRSAEEFLNFGVERDAKKILATIEAIKQIPNIKDAFLANDREATLEAAQDLFSVLKTEDEITHFYIHGVDRVNFVRVHNPPQHSDTIDRFSMKKAEESGKPYYGIEMGESGQFTLRVVVPWYDKGKLIGYLELGEEIDHLLAQIRKALQLDLLIFVKKQYVKQESWTLGMKNLGREADWDQYSSHVLVTSDDGNLHSRSISALVHKKMSETSLEVDQLNVDGRTFRVAFRPIIEVGGNDSAELVVALEISEHRQAIWRFVILVVVLALAIGTVLFVFFWVILGRLEKNILDAKRKLEATIQRRERAESALHALNEELESRIFVRTQKIQQQQDELVQLKKIESLGSLTAGIAHNINNFLFPIGAWAELLIEDYPDKGNVRIAAEKILLSCSRTCDLVSNLMAFSRQEGSEKVHQTIHPIITDVLSMIESTIPATATLHKHLDDDIGDLELNKGQIQTIIVNLISNSVDALQGKTGDVTITLSRTKADKDVDDGLRYSASLTVIDTGAGMNNATMEKMFDPFYTTKPVGNGTGLGLSSVYGIVADHGGTISCTSAPGKGTTFVIFFPMTVGETRG